MSDATAGAAKYWRAHSPSPGGREDWVSEHLRDVAERAAGFAQAFGAGEEARAAGLLHDLGKYGELFQKRLEGKARGVDHWSAGARVALEHMKIPGGLGVGWAVWGHHVGLDAKEKLADLLKAEDLARFVEERYGLRLSERSLDLVAERFQADGLEIPAIETPLVETLANDYPARMLDIRMLFSCLVDADYLETEAHREAEGQEKRYRPPGPELDAERALEAVLSYISEVERRSVAEAAVKSMRRDLLEACLEAAERPVGAYTLTAPTGSGKTLSMLAFALKHAALHGLRRVVYVAPYLTILEQTVDVYRKALATAFPGISPQVYVLEDHSLARAGKGAKREAVVGDEEGLGRLLAENWDAPVIVTTSVQFFESLFANRPRQCRKLHRVAKSVILCDEIQTFPTDLIEPTLAALSRLIERYGCTVVFATATQPAFEHLDERVRQDFHRGWKPAEIVPAELRLFERARRVQVEWPEDPLARVGWDVVVEKMRSYPQALCVVNVKRHAIALFDALATQEKEEDVYHLSTNMCPAHRREVLDRVRGRLAEGERCLLVSTQCVEAGVDVDFPVVFRAWGPLEAIAQAAGRCNREGKRETGTVYLFRPPEDGRNPYPDAAYGQAADVAASLLQRHGTLDIYNPQVFEEYYRQLYRIKGKLTRDELSEALKLFDFPSVAALYRVIKEDAINVVVPYCLEKFEELCAAAEETGLTRQWVFEARPYAVSIFRPRPQDAAWGLLEPVRVGRTGELSDEWFIYRGDANDYDRRKGLILRDVSLLIA